MEVYVGKRKTGCEGGESGNKVRNKVWKGSRKWSKGRNTWNKGGSEDMVFFYRWFGVISSRVIYVGVIQWITESRILQTMHPLRTLHTRSAYKIGTLQTHVKIGKFRHHFGPTSAFQIFTGSISQFLDCYTTLEPGQFYKLYFHPRCSFRTSA